MYIFSIVITTECKLYYVHLGRIPSSDEPFFCAVSFISLRPFVLGQANDY